MFEDLNSFIKKRLIVKFEEFMLNKRSNAAFYRIENIQHLNYSNTWRDVVFRSLFIRLPKLGLYRLMFTIGCLLIYA